MTKQFFYESAAYIATAISSGLSAQTCHPARALLNDYVTPMEMLGNVELIEACVGMKRTEANDLVKQLLKMYEDNIDDAPIGKKYQECYDVNKGEACQEYVDLYGQVKTQLQEMGFNYKQ
jgi:methylamine--corrinoid protein Co-methyltransferase